MDDMFKLLWRQYRSWAISAQVWKKETDRARGGLVALTMAGTAFATLGPFTPFARILTLAGAILLALATYIGRELLVDSRDTRWTRARAAAEALKSEACTYLVQAAPYDTADRRTQLDTRMSSIAAATAALSPAAISDEQAARGMPAGLWTIDTYIEERVRDQITWYNRRAGELGAAVERRRAITLVLGGVAVVIGAVTGVAAGASEATAAANSGTLLGATLGVVTTAGGALGGYYQAGSFSSIAARYHATALALERLVALLEGQPDAATQARLVAQAEEIMRSEHGAWQAEFLQTPATTAPTQKP